MTSRTEHNKKMEDRVYIFHLVAAVEHGAYDIGHTLAHYPQESRQRDSFVKLLHCHEYRQSHKDIAHRLQFVLFLLLAKTEQCAHDGT